MRKNQLRSIVVLGSWVAVLALGVAPAMADNSGSSRAGGDTATPTLTPEQMAVDLYNQAQRARDQALKLEGKLPGLAEPKRAKSAQKITDLFERAADKLEESVDKNPYFFQAHSSRGYALRRLGRYREALDAYDRALTLNPNYPEAQEYRAEAYLGLNRVDDAQAAYNTLATVSPEHAAQLLAAMSRWVESRGSDPQGVAPEVLQKVSQWMSHQQGTAKTVAAPASGRERGWK